MTAKTFDAFVSYSREDHKDVQVILQQLNNPIELKFFVDTEMGLGRLFIKEISEAIARSETFLFFVRNPPKNAQIQEVNAAVRLQIRENSGGKPVIIPVLLPGFSDEAFYDNNQLGMISSLHASIFSSSIRERQVIDQLRRAILNESRVHVSARALSRSDGLPSGFQADVKRLTNILIGESVYKEETIGIRELIQNARDACSRRINKSSKADNQFEIIVRCPTDSLEYFDIVDFGDGMTAETLVSSFSVLGQSLNDEYHIIDKDNQTVEVPIAGKFGIGFISIFMIAKRVVISTRGEGTTSIHLRIEGVDESFYYTEETECNRGREQGTTFRIWLKDKFAKKESGFNLPELVNKYCRHVPNLHLSANGSYDVVESDWNVEAPESLIIHEKTSDHEYRLSWFSKEEKGIILSNGGFYTCAIRSDILGNFPIHILAGEINIAPNLINLTISRDNYVRNDKVERIKDIISKGLSDLIDKSQKYFRGLRKFEEENVKNLKRYIQILSALIDQEAHGYVGSIKVPRVETLKMFAYEVVEIDIINEYLKGSPKGTSFEKAKEVLTNKEKVLINDLPAHQSLHYRDTKGIKPYFDYGNPEFHLQLQRTRKTVNPISVLHNSIPKDGLQIVLASKLPELKEPKKNPKKEDGRSMNYKSLFFIAVAFQITLIISYFIWMRHNN